MKRCSNSHKAYQGYVNAPGCAKCYYCVDCYSAWQSGGEPAVTASIAERTKPTLDKHECVGTAQITALQAEVAEYAAFKAEVVALYTTNFMGKVTLPDPTSLLARIDMDRMIAQVARTCMHHDGKAPDKGTPLNLRSHLTVQWLKGLKVRLGFREAVADNLRATVQDLEYKLADMLGKCCHAHQCQPSPRMHRAVNATPHPSASMSVSKPNKQQLDRIESLSKQAATVSVFWPCFITFAATATFALVAHATW